MSKSAADFLREAAEVIEDRGKARDMEDGERSMSRAVEAYNALCGDRMEGELHGWLFMCCLKLARATAGSTHLDDWTDLAGYAALAAECLSKGEVQFGASVWDHMTRNTTDLIKWGGGDCPVSPATKVMVFMRDGTGGTEQARYWRWQHFELSNDIIAYKVVE